MVLSSNAKVEEMGNDEPNQNDVNFSSPGEGNRNRVRGRMGRRVLGRRKAMI